MRKGGPDGAAFFFLVIHFPLKDINVFKVLNDLTSMPR